MTFFKLSEMACKDGTPYPERFVATRWKFLRATLNDIREQWGAPIKVVSGYRTPSYNKKVGGVPKSQHTQGRAADLVPIQVDHLEDPVSMLHAMILAMYRDGDLPHLGGLGLYESFLHVDVRPADRLRRWKGKGR